MFIFLDLECSLPCQDMRWYRVNNFSALGLLKISIPGICIQNSLPQTLPLQAVTFKFWVSDKLIYSTYPSLEKLNTCGEKWHISRESKRICKILIKVNIIKLSRDPQGSSLDPFVVSIWTGGGALTHSYGLTFYPVFNVFWMWK